MATVRGAMRSEATRSVGDDVVGREGMIDNAWSPHYREAVVVVGIEGDTLTVVPKDPDHFTFASAELPRNSVRIL